MTDIVRRLVGGIWTTEAADSGSGSGITEIESTDLSVTITNPTGPVVDLSVGGGSQTVHLLGPYVVTQADVPNDSDFFVLPYTPTAGDIILDIMCRVVTAFDVGGGPVALNVYDGSTGSSYGSAAFDLTVAGPAQPTTSANGAERLAAVQRFDPAVGVLSTPAFMGGTPPVAQAVRISYADTPVAVGQANIYFLVATPSL